MHEISILNDSLNFIECGGVFVCLCAFCSHNQIVKCVCCISGISQLKLNIKGDYMQRKQNRHIADQHSMCTQGSVHFKMSILNEQYHQGYSVEPKFRKEKN